ncbi:hypothetical protein U8Q05_26780 (plasmid) [Rhizobium ruizarguesonis]|nr:hypothetical protein U8Q05_26780 [Rhizobium ruizarguesonis]
MLSLGSANSSPFDYNEKAERELRTIFTHAHLRKNQDAYLGQEKDQPIPYLLKLALEKSYFEATQTRAIAADAWDMFMTGLPILSTIADVCANMTCIISKMAKLIGKKACSQEKVV